VVRNFEDMNGLAVRIHGQFMVLWLKSIHGIYKVVVGNWHSCKNPWIVHGSIVKIHPWCI
jgi:hypothetical protein